MAKALQKRTWSLSSFLNNIEKRVEKNFVKLALGPMILGTSVLCFFPLFKSFLPLVLGGAVFSFGFFFFSIYFVGSAGLVKFMEGMKLKKEVKRKTLIAEKRLTLGTTAKGHAVFLDGKHFADIENDTKTWYEPFSVTVDFGRSPETLDARNLKDLLLKIHQKAGRDIVHKKAYALAEENCQEYFFGDSFLSIVSYIEDRIEVNNDSISYGYRGIGFLEGGFLNWRANFATKISHKECTDIVQVRAWTKDGALQRMHHILAKRSVDDVLFVYSDDDFDDEEGAAA